MNSAMKIEGLGAVTSSVMGAMGALLEWPLLVILAICLAFIVTWTRISSTRPKTKFKVSPAA